MRTVSFVEHLEFEFHGNLFSKAITVGDVDNDKVCYLFNSRYLLKSLLSPDNTRHFHVYSKPEDLSPASQVF